MLATAPGLGRQRPARQQSRRQVHAQPADHPAVRDDGCDSDSTGLLRASFGLGSTHEEIDRLLTALDEIA
jgi:selenocysteine lyase/cysteine desulfurase